MASVIPELAGLADPHIIQEIDYETRRSQFIDMLRLQLGLVGIDYDVTLLETDPGVVLMEVSAYIDMNLRQRINEAIEANFLAFARGIDLDHLAQFYDVTRQFGEPDDRLRLRIVLAIRGRSTGGTEPRYRSVALDASPRVADAAVYRIGKDPRVHVALFATDNGGIANQALIDIVSAALNNSAVRMVNDVIVVEAAIREVVAITANVWLLPETPSTVLDQMRQILGAAWALQIVLGRDVTRSWIVSKLMVDGVQRVELSSPVSDVIVPFNKSAALGAVTLNLVGRAY